jgi:hypothetical protein
MQLLRYNRAMLRAEFPLSYASMTVCLPAGPSGLLCLAYWTADHRPQWHRGASSPGTHPERVIVGSKSYHQGVRSPRPDTGRTSSPPEETPPGCDQERRRCAPFDCWRRCGTGGLDGIVRWWMPLRQLPLPEPYGQPVCPRIQPAPRSGRHCGLGRAHRLGSGALRPALAGL